MGYAGVLDLVSGDLRQAVRCVALKGQPGGNDSIRREVSELPGAGKFQSSPSSSPSSPLRLPVNPAGQGLALARGLPTNVEDCPMEGKGAGLVFPSGNTEVLALHLADISLAAALPPVIPSSSARRNL